MRDIDELLEEWRQGDGPRIVQAGALKRVADEFDRLRAIEVRARELGERWADHPDGTIARVTGHILDEVPQVASDGR